VTITSACLTSIDLIGLFVLLVSCAACYIVIRFLRLIASVQSRSNAM